MGGKDARGGFWFQDAKALTRLLADALERRRCRVLGLELGPQLRVRIESAVEIVVDSVDGTSETTPRPIWDGTFTVGEVIVVDECKRGGPTRNDRVTFYRRLRATIATGVAVAMLVPRFTVGRGSIRDVERWTDLGVIAQSTEVVSEPPGHVDSVQKLAAEALYYLTTAEPIWTLKEDSDDGTRRVPSTPALTLDDARALLSRFELDAASTVDDVEGEIRAQLDALGASLPADEIVRFLGGWIAEIARARHWVDNLTADSLSEKLTILARYLEIDPAIERLWHRLRTTVPPAAVTMIAEQPWRDVQPQVEPVVRDRAANRRVVFTSEGGIGKSYLLGALFPEQAGTRVWIDAVAPVRDLEEAVALGSWAVARTGEALTLFVDAIDQNSDPAGLLAAIERSLTAFDGSVVYVGARFATWTEIRDRLPRWRDERLTRWGNDRIRTLAEAGRAEPLSADLVDLLRTPLLLDLFLRSFSVGDAVPAGLATRHGVLRAYFERRVYADSAAGARRAVLDAGVDAVLANRASWRDASPEALQLLSEGVVVRPFGELRFRHALLRDFSAALQLVPRTADEIAGVLRAIDSPIVRNELLRGAVEALLDPDPLASGPSIAELVHACTNAGLAPGIALGTTDAPTAGLLAAIATIDGGTVLRQALGHAQLIDNRAWLRVPSALGNARPDWFDGAQLQAAGSLAELALATGDATSSSLAFTLTSWTLGRRGGTDESWSLAAIGALLVRVLPDDATADWFARLALGETGFRSRFLEQLRDLGPSAQVSDATLLRALDNVVFGEGSHVLDGGHSLWEVTKLCLSDHDGHAGLLATRPYVALTLLFALSAAKQIETEGRRRADPVRDHVLAEMFANRLEPPAEFAEAEARLRREPVLTETEALGDLVDDARTTSRHSFNYLATLIDEVEQRAEADAPFADQLADAALASRSVRARIIVLSLPDAGRIGDAAVEVLRDPRIYHVLYASGALWDAIRARWSALPALDRARVQQNILSRARSPLLSFTSVGQLASAIPHNDLDLTLQPFLEFLETTGRSTAPPRRAGVETFSGRINDDEDDPMPSDPSMARFDELARTENEEAATDEAIAILEREIPGLGVTTPDATWAAISRVVGRDERRPVHALAPDSALTLFEAALRAIEPRRPDPETWATLLDVADACPSYLPAAEATALRSRLIKEVVIGAGERAEREEHAWRALHFVRPIAWLGEGTGGRAVFETWFRDHLRGEGLQAGQCFLQFFPVEARLDLVCHVLETNARLDGVECLDFINDAGRMLATLSLWWEPTLVRDRVQRMCEASVRSGSLATDEAWRTFLAGFAWSLQNEVRHAMPDPRVEPGLARLASLLELAWSAWHHMIDDTAQGNVSVGWSITALLARDFEPRIQPPAGGWSAALRPLLPRVISEGGRDDIAAFQQVEWTAFDPETIAPIAEAAIARADREIASRPATDWMVDNLIDVLARVGGLPTLPLPHARRILDCLQRIGGTAPRANSAALSVERALRTREASAC